MQFVAVLFQDSESEAIISRRNGGVRMKRSNLLKQTQKVASINNLP